ncbi:hypothetical protein [Methylosinus sp. Sm6]|uniref:hypothetical protein n=1 Tax=Methylosinus sp. Sm6 TaxID=2866948 RepID=UPI001C99EB6B|nr:hypothetical protein [Methylosinus sp. Sm6]MBY6242521.1 hypothetical protein [Methylosinus sp. Sm6]
MAGLFKVAPLIAVAAFFVVALANKAPAPSTVIPHARAPAAKEIFTGESPSTADILTHGKSTPEPERWTPPVFGESFTEEQKSACDVMIAKAIRLSDLTIERRSSEHVFFRSPIVDANFVIACGKWPGATASYSASAMPPREFFVLLGALGAAVVSARQSEIEDRAAACQEGALKSRSLQTIELPLVGGALQCNTSRESIVFGIAPAAKPVERSAKKGRS